MASRSDRASIKNEISDYLNCPVKIESPNRDHPNMTIYSAYFRNIDDYDDNCNSNVDDYIDGIFRSYGGSLSDTDTDAANCCIWWMMEE